MRLSFRLKHHFFSAFREFFVHHHGSLNFRAEIFALVIAADEKANADSYLVVKEIALEIYNNDTERADLLTLTTKEKVNKVKENNGLDIDVLVTSIQKALKIVPRYAKKIDLDDLQRLLVLTNDEEILSYQENILEFLQTLKNETLKDNKIKIAKDEEKLKEENN